MVLTSFGVSAVNLCRFHEAEVAMAERKSLAMAKLEHSLPMHVSNAQGRFQIILCVLDTTMALY